MMPSSRESDLAGKGGREWQVVMGCENSYVVLGPFLCSWHKTGSFSSASGCICLLPLEPSAEAKIPSMVQAHTGISSR